MALTMITGAQFAIWIGAVRNCEFLIDFVFMTALEEA